jgi:ankyrin repeat protein
VLLEHGADICAKDGEGRTPFQIASAKGDDGDEESEEVMKLLSEDGTKGVL